MCAYVFFVCFCDGYLGGGRVGAWVCACVGAWVLGVLGGVGAWARGCERKRACAHGCVRMRACVRVCVCRCTFSNLGVLGQY